VVMMIGLIDWVVLFIGMLLENRIEEFVILVSYLWFDLIIDVLELFGAISVIDRVFKYEMVFCDSVMAVGKVV